MGRSVAGVVVETAAYPDAGPAATADAGIKDEMPAVGSLAITAHRCRKP
jgi:hypothetical protein